jgi:hypothetical protein
MLYWFRVNRVGQGNTIPHGYDSDRFASQDCTLASRCPLIGVPDSAEGPMADNVSGVAEPDSLARALPQQGP